MRGNYKRDRYDLGYDKYFVRLWSHATAIILTEEDPQFFAGLTREDAEREKIRGVFVIGAIAVLFYLHQMNGNMPVTLGRPPIVITTDMIMEFLGLYVVLTAFALWFPKAKVKSRDLTIMAGFAAWIYSLATFLYFAIILLVIAALIVQFYQMFLPMTAFVILFYIATKLYERYKLNKSSSLARIG